MIVVTSKTLDELRVVADSQTSTELRAQAARHAADAAKAREAIDALLVEQGAIPMLRDEALYSADAGELARLDERAKRLPTEILLAQLSEARATVRRYEGEYAAAIAYRTESRAESDRLGKGAGYPRGMKAGIEADNCYYGSRATVSEMASALGSARRRLDSLIAEASKG